MFDVKMRKVVGFDLAKRYAVPPCEPKTKMSNDNWDANNKLKLQISRNQTIMSRKLTEESKRVMDEVNEVTNRWQREVNHQTHERTDEIDFLSDELQKQRKNAKLEEETLNLYRNRILNMMKKIDKGLEINRECMRLRNCRGGLDLCIDEVETQLLQELKVIKGCDQTIRRALDEITLQLTRLSAAIYSLDKDIADKNTALRLDTFNLVLKEASSNLAPKLDSSRPLCIYSLDEWQHRTAKNIEDNAKELTCASNLRGYIDVLLKQISDDLQRQTEHTNEAFQRRIRETLEIKHLLEAKHLECTTEVINIEKNIYDLAQQLNDRERSLDLCQTRLNNRARRLDIESTCDAAQQALFTEWQHLKASLEKLKRKIQENKAMLRYLTFTVTMQQEEINIKANTLKIDEGECQIMRMDLIYSP